MEFSSTHYYGVYVKKRRSKRTQIFNVSEQEMFWRDAVSSCKRVWRGNSDLGVIRLMDEIIWLRNNWKKCVCFLWPSEMSRLLFLSKTPLWSLRRLFMFCWIFSVYFCSAFINQNIWEFPEVPLFLHSYIYHHRLHACLSKAYNICAVYTQCIHKQLHICLYSV